MLTRCPAPTGGTANPPGEAPAAPAAPAAPPSQPSHPSLTRYRLALDEFDAIASGHGDLATLRAGQLSRRMLLVQALVGAVAEHRPDLAELADLDASLAVLRAAHRAGRAEVDRLLLHPQVGVWGMRCLRLLFGHAAAGDRKAAGDQKAGVNQKVGVNLEAAPPRLDGADSGTLAAQIGCFGTLAATAAMLVGRECDVVAHALDGGLMFPTLGRATVPGLSGWARIRVGLPAGGRPPAAPRPGTRAVSLSVLSPGEPQAVLARFDVELDACPDARTGFDPRAFGALDPTAVRSGVVDRAVGVTVWDATGTRHDATGTRDTGPRDAAGGSDAPAWQPLRALVSEVDGRRLVVDLDDVDPFRSFHHVPPTPRLSDEELVVWRLRLDEAWALLVRHHPGRATTVASALASLIPLRAPRDAEELSASSADACGAVALTLPHSGLALAGSLIHELAHSRLSALLDLVPLFEPDRRAVYFSPWRRDPRPVPGLTQGAFAFLALTDFWNDHRLAAGGAGGRLAQFEYARWRAELPGVLDILMGSGVLTGLGERFVGGMRRGLAAIADGEVPEEAAALADLANAEHWITWRLRNVHPRAAFIDTLGYAWRTGHACPPLPATAVPATAVSAGAARAAVSDPAAPDALAPSAPRFVTHGRLSLSYLRLREPERFAELAREPSRLGAAVPAACPADLLLLTGQAAAASALYQDLIAARPDGIDLWAGFALSRRAARGGGDPLVRRPEVALALYRHLRAAGAAPSPAELADWLAAGAVTSRPGPAVGATPPTAVEGGVAVGGVAGSVAVGGVLATGHSGDGSNTKSTRTPSATSRTSGWSSRSTRR
ncbi:hypothetical protein I6A84_01650 [Frankia sp. CNm7]|uniref:HEXXH motif domain-containing protein n=1 Tax=Frankia nepalensis TaxID=1836974 RepID=A0A937RCU6_9ACTN|nr:HEXXH motif domain-containing protein [Frankia nepalensis]MBL7498134.1 hypothetical protein [Frankia nepalensis]MBL7509348.1 hypothetical protein [Frankia nepalensis]MBL7516864.1 hypothetical protein [Frankia nepalensis]MBL7627922.1 hypothetical protein [Frankia nepalensis]